MSLEGLEKEIKSAAHENAQSILREAEKQAREQVKAAWAEAGRILEKASEEAKRELSSEEAEAVSSAHLEAGKILSHARNVAVERGVGESWKEFSKVPKGKDYSKILKKLSSEGISEVGRGGLVYVRKADFALAKKLGFSVSKKPIDCSGGARVERQDGKVSSDRTLEAVFSERQDFVRSKVHEKLFGGSE